MMCITTVISLISVLLAICIHQQYINAYSKALRVDFAARYGYLVGVLTSLLVIGEQEGGWVGGGVGGGGWGVG